MKYEERNHLKRHNYVCDNDDCQLITPDVWADLRGQRWLCIDCLRQYADITRKTRKATCGGVVNFKDPQKSQRGWKNVMVVLDKTQSTGIIYSPSKGVVK
jgi:hypothetical protein